MAQDTIVALASPPGCGGRAVVRMSGGCALSVADAVFVPASGSSACHASQRGVLSGHLRMGRSRTRVVADAWVMRAPNSMTGEDTVELHLVSAPYLIEILIELLVREGARVAEPGEFTRRAFLNGRIDLTRAEAVLALIQAADKKERHAALASLEGGLERRIATSRDLIQRLLIPIELGLDFSDQDIEIPLPDGFEESLQSIATQLSECAKGRAEYGARRTHWRVVLSGPANAGKSSLFNRLAGETVALVSDVRGTTRDVLCAELRSGESTVELVDVAGDDVTTGEADQAAHRQRQRYLREADLIIEVRDLRRAHQVSRVMEEASRPLSDIQVPKLWVLTHRDLVQIPVAADISTVFHVDALLGNGVAAMRDALWKTLQSLGHKMSSGEGQLHVSGRQSQHLVSASELIQAALRAFKDGLGSECMASDLHGALSELAAITGEAPGESVLDRLFQGFCIGK